MSLHNKKKDFTPFDMTKKPVRQSPLLMPLVWGASYLLTARQGLCIERVGMKGLRPPYLVIATHQGFSDYFILPRALFPHRANYVSDMEGFAGYGERLYRSIGCIGKRRYVPDIAVMNNIRYALRRLRQPVVLFPESRHTDAGITSTLPDNLGRLVKALGVPVAVLTAHGSYLASPFWDEEHTRKTKMTARLELLYSAQQVSELPAETMQQTIVQKLAYDEYRWQLMNKVEINDPDRARGLHLPLYRCIRCGAEGHMESREFHLHCAACGAKWDMDEYGRLYDCRSGEFTAVPDWYRRERMQTEAEIDDRRYSLDVPVEVEALPNAKGFIALGKGRLIHLLEGFTLELEAPPAGLRDAFPLHIPSSRLPSVQTEYNYRGRGACIVLSTQDCCYYVYAQDPAFQVTKLEFAAEYLYKKHR